LEKITDKYGVQVAIVLVVIFFMTTLKTCDYVTTRKPGRIETIKEIHDTIKQVEYKISLKEKEVIKWKQAKEKIVYKTKFDTIATIDTVYIELIKCDSVVKIQDSIIVKQDTIILDQNQIIELQKEVEKQHKKENRKLKRKLFFTKVVAVVVVAGLITLIVL